MKWLCTGTVPSSKRTAGVCPGITGTGHHGSGGTCRSADCYRSPAKRMAGGPQGGTAQKPARNGRNSSYESDQRNKFIGK